VLELYHKPTGEAEIITQPSYDLVAVGRNVNPLLRNNFYSRMSLGEPAFSEGRRTEINNSNIFYIAINFKRGLVS